MKVGFFPGSFDPFTNGHLYIIKQVCQEFDQIIICIKKNALKRQRRFSKDLMKTSIEKVLKEEKIDNATVIIYDGFISRIALSFGTTNLIRGIRNQKDCNYEKLLAVMNKLLLGLNTIYIKGGDISSTKVMKALQKQKDISSMVPHAVYEVIRK